MTNYAITTIGTLEIHKGDSCNIAVTITDSDSQAVNIDGFQFWITVKKLPSLPDSAALIQKTVSSFPTPANGQFSFSLSPTDTSIPVGEYYYDIQMKDSSDAITTFGIGKLIILNEITITRGQ